MRTRFSKLLAVLLSILMIAASLSVAFAAGGSLPGAGTEADPYLIEDADDLLALSADPSAYDGKYIALAGDIDITALCDGSYTPIGTEDAPFKGIFDGQGNAISADDGAGYLIDNIELNYAGLFGYAVDAVIKNVTVKGFIISCGSYVGTAVGYAENTQLSGIRAESCTVDADADMGGIVGYVKDGSVTDCRSNTLLTLWAEENIGGIAGAAVNSEILRCINEGSLMGEGDTLNYGGIVGNVSGAVSHCINMGSVASPYTQNASEASACVGGVAGKAEGEISYCGNTGAVTCPQDCGGVIGFGDNVAVSYCYSAAEAVSDYYVSYPVGRTAEENIINCVSVGDDVTAEDMKAQATYAGWDFDAVWYAPIDAHNYAYPTLRDCNFHTFTQEPPIDPTCTNDGAINYTCTCGLEGKHEVLPALGHAWVEDPENSKAPTCLEDGYKAFKCTREGCDATRQETLDKTPDQHTDVAPEDNICDVCGKTIKEEAVKKNIFQKIADFFRRIIEWIRNLFKR